MSIWSLLEECVRQLEEPFRRSEIIDWFRRHHPEVLESSLAVHILGATADVLSRGPFASRQPLLVRVDRGLYRRAEHGGRPVMEQSSIRGPVAPADVLAAEQGLAALLVGCVKCKQALPARAADLYTSELFRRRRAYAASRSLPWFVISAEHGLLHPDDFVAPYDRALADQSAEYQAAWGAWVVAKLEDILGTLAGRSVEVHAGSAYVESLRNPLRLRRCGLICLCGTCARANSWTGTTTASRRYRLRAPVSKCRRWSTWLHDFPITKGLSRRRS